MSLPPQRPGAVTFVAVVFIAFGCYSLLCGVLGNASNISGLAHPAPPGPINAKDPNQIGEALAAFLGREVPGIFAVTVGSMVCELVFGVIAVVAGINLLRLRPWARRTAILLALVKVPYSVLHYGFTLLYVGPVVTQFFQENPFRDPQGKELPIGGIIQGLVIISSGCGIAIELTVTLIVLLCLNTSTLKNAFAGVTVETPTAEDDRKRGPKYQGYEDEES